MAQMTVSQIMSAIAATVNQDPTAPASGSTDYTLWIYFMQRAQHEWQEAHDWEETRKGFFPVITSTSVATGSSLTIPMPTDFYRLAGPPILWTNFQSGKPWPEIIPEKRTMQSFSDSYFYMLGDLNNGYNMIWNPGTLSSGVSVEVPYFYIAPSLASSGQIPVMQNPEFLVDRTIAYVLEARYDPRFQEIETKAREKLLLMISNHDARKYSSFATPDYVSNAGRKMGFRLGRD